MGNLKIAVAAFTLVSTSLPTALAQSDSLRVGERVASSFSAGAEPVIYTIEVADDSFLFGEVNQIDVDVVVRILDSEDAEVAQFDGPSRGPERFTRRIEEGGTYKIEIAPIKKASGDWEIEILRLEPLETEPNKLTDQLMSPYAGDDTPGAAVQVWRDGETLFSKSYGMANLTWGIPFRTNTRTNIGSTSKQFTAFAIMLLVDRGEVSLDDDIRDYIPELPEFEHVITLRNLLNHTSGLREFLNLVIMEGRRIDHGDWIGRDELIAIVQRQPALQNEPGSEFNYNNTAFGLAAVIVERVSGQDFDDFARENIFAPLGMDRTLVRATREQIVPESAQGYVSGKDGYKAIGDLGGAVGAGGIYSTVEDLQTWVQNYIDPKVGSAQIVEQMLTPDVLPEDQDPDQGYGLGLFIDNQRGLRCVHHGGADIAHRSMLAYYPEIAAGITVQSNRAEFDLSVAFELAEAFFPDAFKPGEFDPSDFDPEAFDEFVGRYALDTDPSFIYTFSREGDTYYAQAPGLPKLELEPVSPVRFGLRRSASRSQFEFERNEEGEVVGVTLFAGGEQHATRLNDEADPPWEPTPDDLAEFEGRYFSAELETFYTIVLETPEADDADDAEASEQPEAEAGAHDDDGAEASKAAGKESPAMRLVVKHRRLDDLALTPVNRDGFSGGRFRTFAFERDRNGQIIGFYLANGRTRDVRFERVEKAASSAFLRSTRTTQQGAP